MDEFLCEELPTITLADLKMIHNVIVYVDELLVNYHPTQARDAKGKWAKDGGGGAHMGLPSVAEDVAELKFKGAHDGEITHYKELTTRRTDLNKKIKDGTATEAHKTEAEHIKVKLAGVRQEIRDRYAKVHGRDKEKAITGKKVTQGKVDKKDSESTSDRVDIKHDHTQKVDHKDVVKTVDTKVKDTKSKDASKTSTTKDTSKTSSGSQTSTGQRTQGPPAAGTMEGLAHLTKHINSMNSNNFAHLADLQTATGWSKEDLHKAIHHGRQQGVITLTSAEGRHGISDRDREHGIIEKDSGGASDEHGRLLLFASVRDGAKIGGSKAGGEGGGTSSGTDSSKVPTIKDDPGSKGAKVDLARQDVIHSIPLNKLRQHLLGGGRDNQLKVIHKLMDEHAQEIGNVMAHGMPKTEKMTAIKIQGINICWSGEPGMRDAAAKTIANMAFASMPAKMWQAQTHIFHTKERNKHDAHWERVYNMPGFTSAATGGNRTVVVYNGHQMSSSTLAHESGHNLAEKVWGDVFPRATSDYSRAQSKEPPVSTYGSNSHAEDFAEACKMYAQDNHTLSRKFPLKHKALVEMIGHDQASGSF